jgi:hypothetical protein
LLLVAGVAEKKTLLLAVLLLLVTVAAAQVAETRAAAFEKSIAYQTSIYVR